MEASSDSGVDTVLESPLGLVPDDALPETPTQIGKYRVVGLLGRGGMGSVYRAVDPSLEREVAVKVLKQSVLRDADEEARSSLLREAKALARLSHPNVVAVYEVGEHEGGFFIAMERVDGEDLHSWLSRAEVDRSEALSRLLAAGRGLQAAHDAGLVHRDFKPGNVLVSAHETKVTDFGLARPASESSLMLSSSSGSIDTAGTQGGTVVGTPSYMSPEQHGGESLEPASDQYSFCVALYEALSGQRPFAGHRGRKLLRAKLAGPPPLPSDAGVPKHVERALRRGLSAAPDDRFPSMAALLRELERDPAARRRRALAGVGLVLAGGAAAGALSLFVEREAEPCVLEPDALAGAWDPEVKASVEGAFEATAQVYAVRTYRRVAQRLDDYAIAWGEARTEACRATVVEKVQSQRVLDMRVACLDERRASLQALTTVLSRESADVLDRVDTMVRSLPPLSVCSNLEQLESQLPDPAADVADAVSEARSSLAMARVMHAAGQSDEASRALERLLPQMRAVDFAPLTAEVLLLQGKVLDQLARHDAAESALEEAAWAAYGVDHHRVVAYAAMALVWNVSDAQSRGADGKIWLGLAEAASRRVPDDPQLSAEVANARGVLLQDLGERAQARAAYERVLALLVDAEGPDELAKAGAMVNLAILESEEKNFEAALELQTRALALRETYEGRAHPRTATLLNNMSTVLLALEREDEAKAANAEALAQLRARYGQDHPLVGTALVQTATLAYGRGEQADAAELLREAASVFEATRGAQHRDLAIIYNNIGEVELGIGNPEAAVTAFERALEVTLANYDEDNERVDEARASLAKAQRKLGEE